MQALVSLVVASSLSLFASAPSVRSIICVDLDPKATWRDMVYLSAIPAAVRANRTEGGAALFALSREGNLSPEAADFVKRFHPSQAVHVGIPGHRPEVGRQVQTKSLVPSGAVQAALQISKAFWKSSRVVVIAREDDYSKALEAAPLANLVDAPLIYSGANGLSEEAAKEISRLGAKEIISFDQKAKFSSAKVVTLAGPGQAMEFAKNRGLRISYLAAVNPYDQSQFVTRRLSLVGAHLAAGRGGLVAPLAFPTEWKRESVSVPFSGSRPSGIPADTQLLKRGTINFNGQSRDFFLTGTKQEKDLKLYMDEGSGRGFATPLKSGDTFEFSGRKWSVSLGKETKFGKSDVHITWPTADELKERLEGFYKILGSRPEYLCLVGFPDALPQAVIGKGGIMDEQASDLPFSIVGKEEFASIAVGRVIAEDVEFGSLYAARALAYPQILDPSWSVNSAQAEWENSFGPLFENSGYRAPYHLSSDEVPWLVPPANGSTGKRAGSFSQDSPLAKCAVIAHNEHSAWTSLGSTFAWDASVLLSPTVFETGGCSTSCLDRSPTNRSVAARLLRLGAIAFAGGSREISAETQPLRMEFWNHVIAGESLGRAQMQSINAGLTIVKENGEGPNGLYRYNAQVRMLIGDPAISLQMPSKPKVSPARSEFNGSRLSVFAPEKWTPVKIIVAPDWKNWAGKNLYAVRGPGAFSMSSWGRDGRNHETPVVMAEFVTKQPVKSIKLETSTSGQLGWSGKWFSEPLPDGSIRHRFLVRMIDFDETTGQILKSLRRLDFRIDY